MHVTGATGKAGVLRLRVGAGEEFGRKNRCDI